MKTQRIDYLDSVRGIAALMVVFYHYIAWQHDGELAYHLSSLIFNGSDAVSFFFVLSGFVLSYKYFQSDVDINIPKFFYRRILRLYPAFMFAVLVNFFYWDWGSGENLLDELVMVRNYHKYYVPGWTLGVEMALSLLMPFIVIIARNNIKNIIYAIPIALFMGAYISSFTIHFLLGTLLAYYYPQIKAYDFSKNKWYKYRWLIGLATFILFSLRHIERISPFGKTYHEVMNFLKIDTFHITGFASFIILIWIINNQKVQDFLIIKPLLFLGKVSYGVYLMHWLIVVYIMEHCEQLSFISSNPSIKFAILLCIAVILTILSATFVYYAIEKPFIKLSRKPLKWFKNT